MRTLQRAAATGDREARKRWVLALVRSGALDEGARILTRMPTGADNDERLSVWEIRGWMANGDALAGVGRKQVRGPELPTCQVVFRRVLRNGRLGSTKSDSSARRNLWAGGIDVVAFFTAYLAEVR